ncbi:SCO family protein [Bacteroidia bacterium]|nr:SCO family protein [Bacteroidia bacterium]MDB9882459.1 SCO family protein [Bacteroidia bacterium]
MKWIVVFSMFLFLSCTSKEQKVPYYFSPDISPTWDLTGYTGERHTIGAFTFLNQNDEIYNSDSLANRIYLANFFFTSCPSICPTMTQNLTKIQDKYLAENIRLVSFSVTPNIDSVARLKEYHEAKGLKSNWNLLTGSQSKIYALSRNSFFVEEEIGLSKDSSDFLHTERCVLVDKKGYIRGVYNATLPLDVNRMIEDIDILLAED